ncbi:hypothetical protein BZZ08_00493 [Streptomyces sp. MH60]|nr:hypothetical protein BZZ08_00493 [Streptomyces sp. MH60]
MAIREAPPHGRPVAVTAFDTAAYTTLGGPLPGTALQRPGPRPRPPTPGAGGRVRSPVRCRPRREPDPDGDREVRLLRSGSGAPRRSAALCAVSSRASSCVMRAWSVIRRGAGPDAVLPPPRALSSAAPRCARPRRPSARRRGNRPRCPARCHRPRTVPRRRAASARTSRPRGMRPRLPRSSGAYGLDSHPDMAAAQDSPAPASQPPAPPSARARRAVGRPRGRRPGGRAHHRAWGTAMPAKDSPRPRATVTNT